MISAMGGAVSHGCMWKQHLQCILKNISRGQRLAIFFLKGLDRTCTGLTSAFFFFYEN